MAQYKVMASHPALPYFHDLIAVHKNEHNGTFYATHRDLGCGKDYRSEHAAIAELMHDHAYSVTLIEKL